MSAETWADRNHEITLFLLDDLNSKCEEIFFLLSVARFSFYVKNMRVVVYGKLKSLCTVRGRVLCTCHIVFVIDPHLIREGTDFFRGFHSIFTR